MVSLKDCIKEISGGVLIEIDVSPSAKKTEFTGIDPWRKRINMRVGAPPQDFGANRELIRYLAEIFGVKERDVSIVHGEKSRKKSVFLPVTLEKALDVIEREMG